MRRAGAGRPAEVEAVIRSTGFFRNKAKNLIGMAQAVVADHGGADPAHHGRAARAAGRRPQDRQRASSATPIGDERRDHGRHPRAAAVALLGLTRETDPEKSSAT